MALRNAGRINIKNWLGLQTTASAQNLDVGWWTASSNVIVTTDSSAACLRSPLNLNTALATTNKVLSAFDYDKQGGPLILFDITTGGANTTTTYSTTGTANTSVRTGQANARWKRANINNWAYGVNGVEFVQTNGTNSYAVGVTAPASASTISYVAGGTGSYAVGVSASYAYRNSTTLEISSPTAASNTLGASGANKKVRVPVVASSQTGVDGIVHFITLDGGSIRYLVIDSNGAPVVSANTTANVDLDIGTILWDTLTPETSFNAVGPLTANYLFKYRNRLLLCDFRGATTRGQVQYCAFESTYYGVPWSCWPALNVINLPNKGDSARCGVETPIGALILGEADSYLIRGTLTDKVSGPQAGVSITESIQPMGWAIGTRSPLTAQTTPFGPMWLDQNKRIQLWSYDGFPVEAGLPIRNLLGDILDTDAARVMAEAVWYQHGKDGGQYVLTACTSGSANNKQFIISVYKDPETGDQRFGCSVSDYAAQCLVVGNIAGRKRLLIGTTDRLKEILDLDTAGSGWTAGQTRYFTTLLGADGEFAYYSSLRFDATDVTGLTVSVSNLDGTDSKNLELVQEVGSGGAYFALLDTYGFRKVITFTFSATDTTKRVIQNLRVAATAKARLI